MDELERFRVRMIAEEHFDKTRPRRRLWVGPVVMLGALIALLRELVERQ